MNENFKDAESQKRVLDSAQDTAKETLKETVDKKTISEIKESKTYLKGLRDATGEKAREKQTAFSQAITQAATEYVEKNPQPGQSSCSPEIIAKVEAEIRTLIDAADQPTAVPAPNPAPAAQPVQARQSEVAPTAVDTAKEDKTAAAEAFKTFTKPTKGLMKSKDTEATTKLQEVLVKLGYENQLKGDRAKAVDGQYGQATHDAVEDLQGKINKAITKKEITGIEPLSPDGDFGPNTHNALAKYLGVKTEPAQIAAPAQITPAAERLTPTGERPAALQAATPEPARVTSPAVPAVPEGPPAAPAANTGNPHPLESTPPTQTETARPAPAVQTPPEAPRPATPTLSIPQIPKYDEKQQIEMQNRIIIMRDGSLFKPHGSSDITADLALEGPGREKLAKLLAVKYPNTGDFEVKSDNQAVGKNLTRELTISISANDKTEAIKTSFLDSSDPARRKENLWNAITKALATGEQEPLDKIKQPVEAPADTKRLIISNQEPAGKISEDELTKLLTPDKFKEYSEKATNKIPDSLVVSKERIDKGDNSLIESTTKTLNTHALNALGISLPTTMLKSEKMTEVTKKLLETGKKMRESFYDTDPETTKDISIPITSTDKTNILQAFLTDNKDLIDAVAKTRAELDKSLLASDKVISASNIKGIKIDLGTPRKFSMEKGYALVPAGASKEAGEKSKYLSEINFSDYSTETITKFTVDGSVTPPTVVIESLNTTGLTKAPPETPTKKSFTLTKLKEDFANASPEFFKEAPGLPKAYDGTTLDMASDEATDITIKQNGGTDTINLGNDKTKEMRWGSDKLSSIVTKPPQLLQTLGIDPNQTVAVLHWQSKWRGTVGKNVDGQIIFTDKGIISINTEGKVDFVPIKSKFPEKPENADKTHTTYQIVDMKFDENKDDYKNYKDVVGETYKTIPDIIKNDETNKALLQGELYKYGTTALGEIKLPINNGPELTKVATFIEQTTDKKTGNIFLSPETKKNIIAAIILDNKALFDTINTTKADFDKKLATIPTGVKGITIDAQKRSIKINPGEYKGNKLDFNFNDYSSGTVPTDIEMTKGLNTPTINIKITRQSPDGSTKSTETVTLTELSEQEKSIDTARKVLDKAGFALGDEIKPATTEAKPTEGQSYKLKQKGGAEIPDISIKINGGKAFITGKVGGGTVGLDINEKLGQTISQTILENELGFKIKPKLDQSILDDKEIIKTLKPTTETKGKGGLYIKTEQGDILFNKTSETKWISMKTGDKFNKGTDSKLERTDITAAKEMFATAKYTLEAQKAPDTGFTIKEIPGITVKFEEGKITIKGKLPDQSTELKTEGLTVDTIKQAVTKIQVENELGIKISDTISPEIIAKLSLDKAVTAEGVFKKGSKLSKDIPSGYEYVKTNKDGAIFVRTNSAKNEWISLATGKLNSRNKVKGILTFVPIKEVESAAKAK